MGRLVIIIHLVVFVLVQVSAQDTLRIKLGEYPVDAIVRNGDTLYVANLEEVVIQPRKREASTRDLRQYRRLIYNIKKVYPYAKIAGEKFGEISARLETMKSGKEQREYIKQMEADIISRYEEELKNLTVTQGRILIKLIDRETSKTSYEVVKELRGSFQAAFWQAIARIFGSNLKTEFDAQGEDKMIEEIMIMIEKGQL
jgi:hypothetical protein